MPSHPLISVTDLCHAYGEGAARREVLRHVNLDFYPGEIVIIMGPSGAGKTTLLTLAGALRSTQSGSIRVGPIELCGASPRDQIEVRRRIGFIFQAHNLLPALTACENVQMGLAHRPDLERSETRQRALAMLERVGLADKADSYPTRMSGGQCQRVAIARALVREPTIIMADEPTAALDKHSGREVVELLQHLARAIPCAILMVTHDNRILDVADRILMLEDGEIEETHRGLDRIADSLTELMQLMARYTSALGDGADGGALDHLAEWQTQFAQRHPEIHLAATAFVARRLNARMAREAARVLDTSEALRSLEEGLREFGTRLLARPARVSATLVDPYLQSLDFLMLTAAETMVEKGADDVDRLIQLTGDRSAVLESVRQGYFETSRELSGAERDYLFDLASLFARLVHSLRRLGELLASGGADHPSGQDVPRH
jgi:putative ABC transport system ATP-binding protein